MNRNRALQIADRIMARIETDKAIGKDAIADEIQAAETLPEIVDIISHDGEKWVRRDGTPFDMDADVKREGINAALMDLLTTGISITRVDPKEFFGIDLADKDTA